jgi:hypothetical protein
MRKLKTYIHGTPNAAGKSQLGHAPGSKVKLQGLKRHHDDHGPNASVPGKGGGQVPSQEHWEKTFRTTPDKDTPRRMGSEFDPRQAKNRMTTHVKVNECDH